MNLVITPLAFVQPIHTLTEGISSAHLDKADPAVNEETVRLQTVGKGKQLHAACPNGTVDIQTVVEALSERRKVLCKGAPTFLINLLAEVSEEMMPAVIADMNIVAAEPDNPESIFMDASGNRCYLCASRRNGKRGLFLVKADRLFPFAYAFLVEDM